MTDHGMLHAAPHPELPRSFSMAGLAAMLIGLGLATIEMRLGFMLRMLGPIGRGVVLVCAAAFSIWGLKEIIAGWWPYLGNRGFGKHRFAWPIEGRIYSVIMIVLFIGSLLGRSNPLMLVFSMMAGPFVLNGWISYTLLRGADVRRQVPRRVMAGELTSAELILENHRPWISPWVMRVRDQITNHETRLAPEVLFSRIPPHGARSGHYQMRLTHRGRYVLGPLQISTRFPLGLVERGINVACVDEVLVYPRIGRLTSDWKRRLWSGTELISHRVPRGGPCDDEFHKLREYRYGDDPRAIHWKTTARRNELMVREFRESRDRRLILLLDAWLPPRPTAHDRDCLELAISFAATVCVDHLRSGSESGMSFAALGRSLVHWEGSGGLGEIEGLLDQLAILTAGHGALTPLLQHDVPSFGPARTLLVTPRPAAVDEAVQQVLRLDRRDDRRLTDGLQVIAADPGSLAPLFDWS